MGMSLHVVGFVPPDEEFEKMQAIWDACEEADVKIPSEVEKFFGFESPDPGGVEVKVPIQEWDHHNNDTCFGMELQVDQIPKEVKVLRFYVSC
jgi:hypothetical protein